MNKILSFSCLILVIYAMTPSRAMGQDTTSINYSLYVDLPLVDMPFVKRSALANLNKNNSKIDGKPSIANYLGGYESPSMQQALQLTKSLHAGNYYLNNRLWKNIIKTDTKSGKIWNRIAANASSGLVDLLFTYKVVVFSPQWLHEEFHRNGLSLRGISSYDETYNRFNGGLANGSVSRVKDEDMIAFKRDANAEMVRSFAAGTESEFLLMRGLQMDNFYKKAKYPNVLLNILLTKHAVDYVNQFKRADFDASIDSMNFYGKTVADRDFVGWDFTAWVYDLHRPNESYAARGVHPSGVGINRAIKASALSQEEYKYLEKMGRMQYLNFISPFMVGIDRIRVNEKLAFNFAVRHYLNSFGYDLSTDLMVDYKGKDYLFSFHGYRNRDRFFPGAEMRFPEHNFFQKLAVQPTVHLWMQPKEQSFYALKGAAGASFTLKASYPVLKKLNIYSELTTKSRGWVAGNPYLSPNTSWRFGISSNLGG